jgi:DivIVA domain-containing protein
MTDLDTRRPEFAVALRGYDRIQVDEYVDRLQDMLAAAEQRAKSTEAGSAWGAHADIGPRVSEIFEVAAAEANEVCEQIKRQAQEMRTKAQTEAENMMSTAQRTAKRAVAQSRQEHQALADELEAEREQIRAHVAELEQRKAMLLQELRRIHEALGSVAGLAPDVAGELPPASGDSKADGPASEDPGTEVTMEQVSLRRAAA